MFKEFGRSWDLELLFFLEVLLHCESWRIKKKVYWERLILIGVEKRRRNVFKTHLIVFQCVLCGSRQNISVFKSWNQIQAKWDLHSFVWVSLQTTCLLLTLLTFSIPSSTDDKTTQVPSDENDVLKLWYGCITTLASCMKMRRKT